ncbi:type II toxin-antitoxin system MqsA family antitoxin [Endozoicomonas sp. 4G]|uniref:type II toxin-antitoxin system MqsA family antitoxin n=1 Tax=Endozoicomonas sp. 4G TaxID=2872754 RepID=UPI002078950D|nr:type II toxin-antitoxin system MqsA family antitoxin [Endozoicomonas sp. 4G]
MSVQCELCGEQACREIRPMEYSYKGHSITLDQPGVYCDSCGEVLLEPEDLKATRANLMEFHANVDGILGPSQIKRIRKLLNMTQKELGLLLGGGPNAFSRYEQGITAAPRAVSIALRLLARHPEDVKQVTDSFATQPSQDFTQISG